MTTQSTPEQPRLYNLAEHDEYEVAAKIASEVIQTGESTGWSETELGEQNEIADILLYYNIYPGDQPGTWDFKPERPSLPLTTMLRNGLVRQGDFNEFLGGLNQFCFLFGITVPLTDEQLADRYGDRAHFLAEWIVKTLDAAFEGFVLPEDAWNILGAGVVSDVLK